MNNKGFTLVELILGVVVVTLLIIPVYILVLSFIERQQSASDRSQLMEYKNTLTYDIQQEILGKGLKSLEEADSCSKNICFNLINSDNKVKVLALGEDSISFNNKEYKLTVPNARIKTEDYVSKYDELIRKNGQYIYFEIPIVYLEDDADSMLYYNVRIVAKLTS